MLIDYIRQVHATQNFKISNDQFEFLEFDDLTRETVSDQVPEQIELWAAVKVKYAGTIPDSYKILNLTIGDWVAKNVTALSKVLHAKLKQHCDSQYPNSDTSEISEEDVDDSAIWEDQLDYMPRVDEDQKTIIIEIEMVLEAEPLEE